MNDIPWWVWLAGAWFLLRDKKNRTTHTTTSGGYEFSNDSTDNPDTIRRTR